MPIQSRYLFMTSMDVDPAVEDLLNEVYDTEHIPYLKDVPGVHTVTRMKGEPFRFAIGGEIKDIPAPVPVYTAIYEIDSPEVMSSPEWAKAVERGRWASEVRPYTKNRKQALYRII